MKTLKKLYEKPKADTGKTNPTDLKEGRHEKMTKDEIIKELEEYLQDIDKCISEDDEYIRGWKSAMLVAIEILTQM